jgi:predicted DNA-binding transcriptional regulator AlpA
MQRRLRYADLERLGIVNNRETLQNWIRKQGFPRGQLTGPNSRTWGEDEVRAWLDSRPTAAKQHGQELPKPTGRRGRRRKSVGAESQTLQP